MPLTGATIDGSSNDGRALACDSAGLDTGADTLRVPLVARTDIAPVMQGRWPSRFSSSAVLSFLAHASLLVWLVVEPPLQAGQAGKELDAIGVEIVDAAALESVALQRAPASSGGAESVVAEAGAEMPVTQHEAAAAAPTPELTDVTSTLPALLKGEPEPVVVAEIAVAAIVREQQERPPVAEPRKEMLAEPLPDKLPETDDGRDNVLQVEQQASVTGGARSRAADASTASDAAASASPGQLARFAMQVRASLGQTRPRHLGTRGRVHIAFVLSDKGTLLSAEIARSSSNLSLDEAAIHAVRTAPFPRPPAGTSEPQRSFVVPFDFK
jgi:TonB family protein